MKNVTLILAMILFSSCVTSEVIAIELESSTNEELYSLHHHPHFHPNLHWPFRPTPFHPPPEVIKCLSDKKEVRTCFDDIARTFSTKKAAIGSECCAAIQKMTKDCEKTVFGSFHNPFWTGYVKIHCSTVVGSTSPAPSLAPSPAPSLALSPAPSLAPSPAPSLALSPVPSLAPSPAPSPAQGF